MKARRLTGMVVAAGVAAVLGGCMTVRPSDPVYIRQQQIQASQQKLETRIQRLDRVLNNHSLSSLSQTQESLQQQVNELRGAIQELQHKQQLSTKQQRDLYSDLNRRVRKLELGVKATPAVASAAATGTTSAAPAAASGSDQAAYQQNLALLKQGRYQAAITGFTDFIQQYPQSALVPNAEFWMGEAHYQMKDFQGALVNYQAVVQGYPDSNKAPGALLKIGYSQYEMKNYTAAHKTLDQVLKQYPNSNVAKLARQRLKQMRKQGH